MSKIKSPRIAQPGDTASSLALIAYGDSSKAYIIVQANISLYPASLPPNVLKQNILFKPGEPIVIPSDQAVAQKPAGNNKKSNSTPIVQDLSFTQIKLPEPKNENLKITIDGFTFIYFDDVTINMSFDSIADTFSLQVPYDSTNEDFRKLMRPFSYKELALYIGGEKMLTGNIVSLKTDNKPDARTIQIDGYAKTGILNDCCPSSGTKMDFRDLNLMQIADVLCKPYGISVIFESSPGAAFTSTDKIQIDRNKKIVEILTPLAKQRGFVISNTRHGELLFHKTDDTEIPTMRVETGKPPCIGSSATYNGQNRFSDITVTKAKTDKSKNESLSFRDPELAGQGIFRSVILSADSTEVGNLQTAAKAKIGRTIAESVQINADFFGWRRPDGQLWYPGQKFYYKSPDDFIYSFWEVMVRSVSYKRNNNSQTVSLNLCFPQCYNGRIMEAWPWDSSGKLFNIF